MSKQTVFFSRCPEETENAGREIAKLIRKGDVLCLSGNLGAGKTTLVKGIAKEFAGIETQDVTSPTFSYVHCYGDKQNLYHFDLYRLSSSEEFVKAGFLDFFGSDSVCCVEWPDKLPLFLSLQKVHIFIEYLSLEERKITLTREDAQHSVH